MSKTPRSFSIDDDLAELLSERDDINASAAVNTFLREYVGGGRGDEAALELRLRQLDEDISELEQTLTSKQRERDRIEQRLQEKRSALDEIADEFVNKIESGAFTGDLSPDNPAIQTQASNAAVDAKRFVDEVKGRLNHE